jgi:hypothetical protein
MVSDGTWAKMDILFIFATQDTTTAQLNLVSSTFSASLISTPTFTADRGFTGNATAGVTSNFNPATASSPNYVQDSAHLSTWNLSNISEAQAVILNGNGSIGLYPSFSGTDFYGRVNDTGSPYTIGADNRGHLLTTRTTSTNRNGYQNGGLLGSITQASSAPDNSIVKLLADGSTRQIAMMSAGGSLNATDELNFYNRLRTYMTAVGVP